MGVVGQWKGYPVWAGYYKSYAGIALLWMDFIEKTRSSTCRHASRGYESIRGLYVHQS